MEMSNILLQDVDACHVGNLDEHLSSTRAMLPGMLAYNNHDYGKCLPDYWAMISSLPYEKKKYFSEHFAQSSHYESGFETENKGGFNYYRTIHSCSTLHVM